jgi:hypothetical protein
MMLPKPAAIVRGRMLKYDNVCCCRASRTPFSSATPQALAQRVKAAARRARAMYSPGVADLGWLVGEDDNAEPITASDVSWAMVEDMESLGQLATTLAANEDRLDDGGRTMLVAIGEGIADPWMLGLAGLNGREYSLGFFKSIGKAFKGVVKTVGKVAGVVAPIAAIIPGGQAIAAGAAAVSAATGSRGGQGAPSPNPPAVVAQSDAANAANNAIEAAKNNPSAPPWWSKLLELAITAGKERSASAPVDDAPQGTPAIATKSGSLTLSTPLAFALAAGALLILARK